MQKQALQILCDFARGTEPPHKVIRNGGAINVFTNSVEEVDL
jgi:hypothetical protein